VLVLGLTWTGHAAATHFLVEGSVSQTDCAPQWGPTVAAFYTWSETVSAVDNVADGLKVTDGASLVKEWAIGRVTSDQTAYTVQYVIASDLITEIAGDWASGDVLVRLEIIGIVLFKRFCLAAGPDKSVRP